MAETDVRKQSSSERSQQSGGLERRGTYLPLNPSELFSMSPFALMRRFTDEMDRVFEGLGGRQRRAGELAVWSPTVEVREREGKVEVVADLPGIKEDDVKVEVTDEGLVIRGERKQEKEEKREGYYRSERSYGQFYRLIPLPENAHLDQAQAEFRNGELRVSIPVPERQRRVREVPISASGERKEAQSQTAGAQQVRKAAG